MPIRFIVYALLFAVLFAGCQTAADKKEAAKKAQEKALKQNAKPSIPDAAGDTQFQAFIGRLRMAVQKKDRAVIVSMMDSNFGWRFDTPPAGETPFDYWEQNNLWSELESVLSNRFVPNESYMVSPPEFVTNPSYKGYRAGIRSVGGNWRFSYFVTGEDLLQ